MAAIVKRFVLVPTFRKISQDLYEKRLASVGDHKVYTEPFFVKGEKLREVNINYNVEQEIEDEKHETVFSYYTLKKKASEAKQSVFLAAYSWYLCLEGCSSMPSWEKWESKGGFLMLPKKCCHDSCLVEVSEEVYNTNGKWMVNNVYIRLTVAKKVLFFRVENPWPWGLWQNCNKFTIRLKRYIQKVLANSESADLECEEMDGRIIETEKDMIKFEEEFRDECWKYQASKLELD